MSCSFIVYLLLTVLKALAVSSFLSKVIGSSLEEELLWGDWLSISFFSVSLWEGVELRTVKKYEKYFVNTRTTRQLVLRRVIKKNLAIKREDFRLVVQNEDKIQILKFIYAK